jgi:hypothetical protein
MLLGLDAVQIAFLILVAKSLVALVDCKDRHFFDLRRSSTNESKSVFLILK